MFPESLQKTLDAEPSVLVVDDDPLHNEDFGWRLRRSGYRVETVETGVDALERIAEVTYDSVLLDIDLRGGLSGLDVLRDVRAKTDATTLPIVMVTASGGDRVVLECLECGANDYIIKPISFPIALARLRTQVSLSRAFAALRESALHDALTGLANRALIDETLSQAQARAGRTGKRFALVVADLDDFKEINDRYGHAAGDLLLNGVAVRLRGATRDMDTVGRLGGDEFVLILEGLERPENVETILRRVQSALARPFMIQGRSVSAAASFGYCLSDSVGDEGIETMFRAADRDMYSKKRARKAVA